MGGSTSLISSFGDRQFGRASARATASRTGTSNAETVQLGDRTNTPACFLQGTSLRTPLGQTYVEYLREGDLISTVDHGPLPIRWIGWQTVEFSEDCAEHKPILIKEGAFGGGLPTRDLAVSPLHHVALEGSAIEYLIGQSEVLAQAHALCTLPKIRRMHGKTVARYYSVLLDHHALVWADGLRAESFYPTPTALDRLGPVQQDAIAMRFPDLTADTARSYGPPARLRLNGEDSQILTGALAKKRPQAHMAAA